MTGDASDAAIRRCEARRRALLETLPQLVWHASPGGHWTWASPQWTAFTGQAEPDSRGRGWLDCVHPDDRSDAEARWGEAEATGVFAAEYRIRRAGAGGDRHHRFRARAAPVRDDHGRIVEWVGASTDIDEVRTLEEHRSAMEAELQHRTRNLLGVVQALAARTRRASPGLDAFGPAFDRRLGALGRVQGLLSRAEREPITVDALLRAELDAAEPHPAGRVVLDGPAVPLRKTVVQTLSLALHELAANAARRGARRGGQATLRVAWRVEAGQDGPSLALDWHETGLEAADAAGHGSAEDGFGREFIERALPYALGARTAWSLADTAFRCTIVLPLRVADADAGGG